jgi:penicillin-binding protein 1A
VIIGKDGLPVLPEFPLGDGDTGVILRDGEAVLQTDVNGVPVDIGIGRNGVRIDGEAIDEARRRAREQVQEAEDRLREAQEQAAEDARATIERAREGRGP